MGFFFALRSAAVALVLAAGTAHAADAALLPVMAADLLEPQKRAIDARIRAVAAENGVSLQGASETTSGLEQAKKAGAACNVESLACQAQMGVLLGTKQVIIARVASDWAGDRLELRLLDALRGTTVREAAQVLPKADGEARTRVIDGVILSVVAPKKTGGLAITATEGVVFVDGVEQKSPAASKIEGLAPGPHEIELRVDKKVVEQKRVTIASGAIAEVSLGKVVEAQKPTPEASPLPLYLVGGGGALAAVGLVGVGGLEAALELTAMERGTRNVLQATGLAFLGATAVGAVVAGAGGVMMATSTPTEASNGLGGTR